MFQKTNRETNSIPVSSGSKTHTAVNDAKQIQRKSEASQTENRYKELSEDQKRLLKRVSRSIFAGMGVSFNQGILKYEGRDTFALHLNNGSQAGLKELLKNGHKLILEVVKNYSLEASTPNENAGKLLLRIIGKLGTIPEINLSEMKIGETQEKSIILNNDLYRLCVSKNKTGIFKRAGIELLKRINLIDKNATSDIDFKITLKNQNQNSSTEDKMIKAPNLGQRLFAKGVVASSILALTGGVVGLASSLGANNLFALGTSALFSVAISIKFSDFVIKKLMPKVDLN